MSVPNIEPIGGIGNTGIVNTGAHIRDVDPKLFYLRPNDYPLVSLLFTIGTTLVKDKSTSEGLYKLEGSAVGVVPTTNPKFEHNESEMLKFEFGVTTAVATTGTDYIRCNRKEVDEVGTYNVSNDGAITTRVVSVGATQATIDIGSGQTHKTHYTIPAGKKAYLLRVSLSADASKVCTFYMVKRENPNGLSAPYKAHRHMHEWVGVDAPVDENFKAWKNETTEKILVPHSTSYEKGDTFYNEH